MNDAFNPAFSTGVSLPRPIPGADMLADSPVSSQQNPELLALRQEVAALRQWKEDATRFMQQFSQPQAAPAFSQQNNGSVSPQLLNDPAAFANFVADEATKQLQAQMEIEHLLNEFRSRHNDLQPFETSILLEAQQISQNASLQGVPLSDRDAIEQAIGLFRSRLSVFNGVNLNTNNAASQNNDSGRALQHMALQLDTGSASIDAKKLSGDDIFHMPPDQFEQFRVALRQQRAQ